MLAACGLLGACFVSDDPLIPQGEAVLPIDHSLTLCPDGPDQCFDMQVVGDGYVIGPDQQNDESGAARFSPLVQIDGRQIFLLEAHDSEDDVYSYLVARRRSIDEVSDADMDLALVVCSDLTELQISAFEAAGGEVSSGFGSGCRAPDLATLKTTLRQAYRDQFSDEAWWAEGGAD